MKANELRIGNWMNWEGDEAQWTLYNFKDLEFTDSYIDCEPIPLTEEWLVKFGFKKPAHSWIGSKFHLSQYDRDKELWICALNKNNAILSNIRYVHQLQNLYFALVGEELESL